MRPDTTSGLPRASASWSTRSTPRSASSSSSCSTSTTPAMSVARTATATSRSARGRSGARESGPSSVNLAFRGCRRSSRAPVSRVTPPRRRTSRSCGASGGRRRGSGDLRLPRVEEIERVGVSVDQARVLRDRLYVENRGVVGAQRGSVAIRRAVGAQQAGGGEDRIVRVADVASVAVELPGGGDELHGALRAGDAVVDHAPELRLDQMDGGQIAGADPETALRLVVEPDEIGERWALSELQLLVRSPRRQPKQRAPRGVQTADFIPNRPAEQRQNPSSEVGVIPEEVDLVLKDRGPVNDVRRGSARWWIPRRAPGVDRLAQIGAVLADLIRDPLGRGRLGVAAADEGDDR